MKTKQNKSFNESLIIYSIITIPLLTILLGTRESPFKYTLSMIGNWFGYNISFIIWGLITSALICIIIIHIYKKTKFKNKKAYRFLYFSAIFLILTVITPTIHEEPIEQELRELFQFNFHGMFGILFAIFLITSLYLFSKYLTITKKETTIKSAKWLLITIGGSIITLFLFGMTGIFEIFFFVSLSAFLYVTNKKIN